MAQIQAGMDDMQKGMGRLLAREDKMAAKEEREEKEAKEREKYFRHDGAPPPVNTKFQWTNWNSKTHVISFKCYLRIYIFPPSFTLKKKQREREKSKRKREFGI